MGKPRASHIEEKKSYRKKLKRNRDSPVYERFYNKNCKE